MHEGFAMKLRPMILNGTLGVVLVAVLAVLPCVAITADKARGQVLQFDILVNLWWSA
jgi:hypothetical protein